MINNCSGSRYQGVERVESIMIAINIFFFRSRSPSTALHYTRAIFHFQCGPFRKLRPWRASIRMWPVRVCVCVCVCVCVLGPRVWENVGRRIVWPPADLQPLAPSGLPVLHFPISGQPPYLQLIPLHEDIRPKKALARAASFSFQITENQLFLFSFFLPLPKPKRLFFLTSWKLIRTFNSGRPVFFLDIDT